MVQRSADILGLHTAGMLAARPKCDARSRGIYDHLLTTRAPWILACISVGLLCAEPP